MHIPIDLAIGGQFGVFDGEEVGGNARSGPGVDEGVEEEGDEDFVDMKRQRGQVKEVGERLDGGLEEGNGWDGERVLHRCRGSKESLRTCDVEVVDSRL